jgi:hypothetical protein
MISALSPSAETETPETAESRTARASAKAGSVKKNSRGKRTASRFHDKYSETMAESFRSPPRIADPPFGASP